MPENKGETALGFDFGMKRIGVAVGQTLTKTAADLCVILAQDGVPQWDKIKLLIEEWDAKLLVVGLPLRLDGNFQAITYAAKSFSKKLERFHLPIHLCDERFTSAEALNYLKQHKKHHLKKEKRDSLAAKIILESFLQTY